MIWVRLLLAVHLAAVGMGRAAAMRHANRHALYYTAPPQTSDSLAKLSTYLQFLLATLYTINPASLPDTLVLALPWAEPLRVLGTALLAVGCALFMWSHRTLAQFWTGDPGLRQGHRLVQGGLYAWMRHPMYTAFLLLDLGALLLIQNAVLFAPLILWLAFPARARREEALLSRVFGHEYAAYRQTTGMFVPRVAWRQIEAPAQARPETSL